MHIQAQDPKEILVDLARDFSRGVELECNCKFPDSYIANGQLLCHNGTLIYQARIVGTDDRDSTQLLVDLEKWLSGGPTIIVQGEVLKLVIPGTTPTLQPEQEESSSDSGLVYGSVAGVVAILLLLAATVFLTVVVLCKHR